MKNWKLEIIAIVISFIAVAFSAWQAYEAHQTRLDARRSQTEARKDWEDEQKVQRELAESAVNEAKRSADAAEKSAAALLSTTRTLEATSQLKLEPNIEVEARFQPFGSPPIQPRIILWNTGAADALAVSVALKLWVASTSDDGRKWAMLNVADILPDWRIPRLLAGEVSVLKVKSQPTEAPSSHLPGRETRQPFLELVIRYLRPADRHSYEKRAYYFVSKEDRWVSENHPSSRTEMNERIKKHLRKSPLWKVEHRFGLDLTHDVKLPMLRKR